MTVLKYCILLLNNSQTLRNISKGEQMRNVILMRLKQNLTHTYNVSSDCGMTGSVSDSLINRFAWARDKWQVMCGP